MQISLPEVIDLRDALADALELHELDDVVLKLGQKRGRITIAGNLDQIYREVIVYYNNRNHVDKLLTAARSVNPTNPALYRFDQRLGRATRFPPAAADNDGLEAIVRPHLPSFNARDWLERAATAESRVCLISGAAGPLGTGFLVGPDAVLTNYHVVRRYIEDGVDPAGLRARFDFMFAGTGTTFEPALPEWLIDHSPLDPSDQAAGLTAPPEVPADRLDYAVIRLAGRPGTKPVGGDAAPPGRAHERGWLPFSEESYDFAGQRALLVFHHAQGRPLELSIDTDSFLAANAGGTRVFHATTTDAGSSGSPCFDLAWNPVALHQGFSVLNGKTVNRAAPLTAVRRLLAERGKLETITG